MRNKSLLSFLTLAISMLTIGGIRAQEVTQPFAIRDSAKNAIDVDQYIIRGEKKTLQLNGDTASVDYKSLSNIDPAWIKKIELLKGNHLHGGEQKTVALITLKRGKIKRLPDEIRAKFQ